MYASYITWGSTTLLKGNGGGLYINDMVLRKQSGTSSGTCHGGGSNLSCRYNNVWGGGAIGYSGNGGGGAYSFSNTGDQLLVVGVVLLIHQTVGEVEESDFMVLEYQV